ncbi:peptidoglycan DD-metalloendopeptidase family protein [Geoalkalibacter subterraneus]|uniref:peptidoglycan DD-metalloendopeptidase family protein n=1 Tax=Geoalkalibacter subterraneus TaxID=483547 RepID=UPI0006938FE7|nr:peptidoglycan DD-metalloendopeptidase family protein [Geoalkalibacter subterraneus]
MDFDFNPPQSSNRSKRRSRFRDRLPLLFMCLAAAFTAGFFLLQQDAGVTEAHFQPDPVEVQAADDADSPPAISSLENHRPEPEIAREVIKDFIAPGDTITALFKDHFSPQEIHRLSQQSQKVFPLTGICAGQPYQICLADGDFESFLYEIDREEQLLVKKGEEGFEIERIPIPYTVETEIVQGRIESNLFSAIADSGEAPELAMRLADIFAWDVDFILDIRQGDSFKALVEKRYREGEPSGYGRILAAQFINQGKTFDAILFKDGERSAAYYDSEGRSLRKAFLKAPLSFTRISSGYTMRRYHPITKTWKSHPAIDYAAPTGTPIKTVGDGTIIRIGYTRANGNFMEIRHVNGYTSLYLHMSKFARGMTQGKRLSQGQVIGYVGSTGLATGPHLCFRMRKNGAPINPARIKAPAAPSVSSQNMAEFKQHAAPLLAQLDGDANIRQAQIESNP